MRREDHEWSFYMEKLEMIYFRNEGIKKALKPPWIQNAQSGQEDSNLRPSAPKADALARLRYAPNAFNHTRN